MGEYIEPGEANLASFAALPADKPIHMLNFLRFRDEAEYPEGHVHGGNGWSGERAYEQYGMEIAPAFMKAGASIIWRSKPQMTMIGPDGETWDEMLVVAYPTAAAFLGMIADPIYQAGMVNRTAALADSRLYRTEPGEEA